MFPVRYIPKIIHNLTINYLNKYRNLRPAYNYFGLYYSSSTLNYNLQIENLSLDEYVSKLEEEYADILKKENFMSNLRWIELKPVINILEERRIVIENLSNLKEFIEAEDKDISEMAKEEKVLFEDKLNDLNNLLLEALLPAEKIDSCEDIVLEIQAGVGGQEAMLFAQELFDMYCSFITYNGWKYEIAEYLSTDLGGLRRASLLVNGPDVFKYFRYEGGVHRVQRTPATEKGGRIHTSTVSVVLLPQPSDIEIVIDQKDLKIETKRSTGAGGQHVNTTDSAVRITHLPTNIAVECQVDRSQIKNRKLALARLRALLYQRELDCQIAKTAATRKSQVKSNNRNEKIRTYNYNQDRITDHRLQGVHFHNLEGFLEGGGELNRMVEQLDRQSKINNLLELVQKNIK